MTPNHDHEVGTGTSIEQHMEVLSNDGGISPTETTTFSEAEATASLENQLRVRETCINLINAAKRGDWERARNLVGHETTLWTVGINPPGQTVLMVAAVACQWRFVEKLVEYLPPEAFAAQDVFGATVLHLVAFLGSVRTAKALVQKNSLLLRITDKQGRIPLLMSIDRPHNKAMVRYLTSVTREYPMPSCPFTGTMSGLLIGSLIAAGYNDITLRLVRRYPRLALADFGNGWHLTRHLSMYPSAFLSGSKLTFWEKLIYKFVHIAENEYANTEGLAEMDTPILSSRHFLVRASLTIPGVKRVREAKLQHVCAVELVKHVCMQLISNMNTQQPHIYLKEVMYTATSSGNVEMVSTCLQHFPDLIWFMIPENGKSILHVAVECRQHKIFNLINEFPTVCPVLATYNAESGNTLWHLAAKLAPATQLLSIAGAAMQMQQEVQWFREVEKLVRPSFRNATNAEGKTAEEVFREEHRVLAEKGERWMKDTANSCMIASTIIATMVFAATFNVPGANASNKGIPIFFQDQLFTLFVISDALALFSSSTSLLMFLAILTARYEPEDFLVALPKRLIIGIGSLFFSVILIMMAFGVTMYIVLGKKWQWVYIPIVLLAAIPVTSFAMLQLPLLIQMVRSTYGSGIFVKRQYW